MLDLQVSPMPLARGSCSGASRILCLKLQELPSSFGIKTKKRTAHAIAESFLKFSPRLVYRLSEEASGHRLLWLFIDIASTSHLFHGEEECAREACALSQALGYGVQYSVSDTPSGAQAFIAAHPNTICPPGEEREHLKTLSLPLLLHLEGVEAWAESGAKPSQIESILTFFLTIGFKTVGDLARLSSSSFHERWGSVGLLLWKRLNALDRAVISPLMPTEPLEDYVHLDFPISLVPLLIRHSEKSLDYLFARLQGRRLFASRLVFIFHCEYSGARHRIEIEPNTPSRDRALFETLLENRLSALNLENPIRDFEVHIVPCAEKAPQLDFFEPRATHADRLETLFSLLLQSSVKPGLFELQEAVMPEASWRVTSEPATRGETVVRPEEVTIRRQRLRAAEAGISFGDGSFGGSPVGAAIDGSRESTRPSARVAEKSLAYRPAYGAPVKMAPRPTRLLNEPIPLTIEEIERCKILSSTPIERLETAWWEETTMSPPYARSQKRDYYFAVSPEGQCLWIFQDLLTEEYFLHGYFD
jgi:protein ImuB